MLIPCRDIRLVLWLWMGLVPPVADNVVRLAGVRIFCNQPVLQPCDLFLRGTTLLVTLDQQSLPLHISLLMDLFHPRQVFANLLPFGIVFLRLARLKIKSPQCAVT